MWVRLRSSLPGEAIRSSTWNSSALSHGICFFFAEDRQHRPGAAAAAHRQREDVALGDRGGADRRDHLGGAARRRLFVGADLELDCHVPCLGRLLVVATELLAHRRENLVGEVVEPTRGEALV